MNDVTRVIRAAQRQGLEFVHGGKHPKIRDPRTGRSISIAGTPSCRHAAKNVARDIRKYLGIDLAI
jgi:hypothetical protein